MKELTVPAKFIGGAFCLFLSMTLSAFSQGEQLSLKHGVYVSTAARCKNFPNAAMLS